MENLDNTGWAWMLMRWLSPFSPFSGEEDKRESFMLANVRSGEPRLTMKDGSAMCVMPLSFLLDRNFRKLKNPKNLAEIEGSRTKKMQSITQRMPPTTEPKISTLREELTPPLFFAESFAELVFADVGSGF